MLDVNVNMCAGHVYIHVRVHLLYIHVHTTIYRMDFSCKGNNYYFTILLLQNTSLHEHFGSTKMTRVSQEQGKHTSFNQNSFPIVRLSPFPPSPFLPPLHLLGGGTLKSCICGMFVWPGLGSKAGTSAENDCLMMQSSPHIFLSLSSIDESSFC